MTDDTKVRDESGLEIAQTTDALQKALTAAEGFDADIKGAGDALTAMEQQFGILEDEFKVFDSGIPPVGSESEYAQMIQELQTEAAKDEE